MFDLTTRNIAHLGAPIELVPGSYKDLVGPRRHPADHLIVVFLGPPWGDALRPDTGLHLDWTKPPILEIVHDFEQVYGAQPVLYVTEVHEVNEPNALKAVTSPHLRCQRAPPSTWCSSRHSPMVMASADEVIE